MKTSGRPGRPHTGRPGRTDGSERFDPYDTNPGESLELRFVEPERSGRSDDHDLELIPDRLPTQASHDRADRLIVVGR